MSYLSFCKVASLILNMDVLKSIFLGVVSLTAIVTLAMILLPSVSGKLDSSDANPRSKRTLLRIGACKSVVSGTCESNKIVYMLFTQNNSTNGSEIILNNNDGSHTSNILNTDFDPSLPTKIIIHGYNADMYMGDLVEIKNQYLTRTSLNVVCIDWSSISQGPCYSSAAWNARFVGECLARLVKAIRAVSTIDDIHIIGFSLGAHVAGFTGKNVRAAGAPKVTRITGLDPAHPGFILGGESTRLDANDAEFVDVVHTNAMLMGRPGRTGHADFYVNGGTFQKGCGFNIFNCNHHRAAKYFAESIYSEAGFWGKPYPSYWSYVFGRSPSKRDAKLMGEPADKSAQGIYFVETNDSPPYALGVR